MSIDPGTLHRRIMRASSERKERMGARPAAIEDAIAQLEVAGRMVPGRFPMALAVARHCRHRIDRFDLVGGFALGGLSDAVVLLMGFRRGDRNDDKCRLLRLRAGLGMVDAVVVSIGDATDVQELYAGNPFTCSTTLLAELADIIDCEVL